MVVLLVLLVFLTLPWHYHANSDSQSCENCSQCNVNYPELVSPPHNRSETTFQGPCPPGFDLYGDTCECGAADFVGISKCESERAFVIPGYWVGLCKNNSVFCTGNCPFGFCMYKNSTDYRLPLTFSELEEFICGEDRTGVLCGGCHENRSVSYHSYSYTCTSNELCNLGWLFYILSELIPLTVVFILVMIFNVSFTSGNFNGFILFAQIQDSLTVHGNGVIRTPPELQFLTSFHRLIYRFFNFDFFSIEQLSFCLWKNATVLDAMVLKYVTIVYGLCLVFICVFIMNTSRVRRACLYLSPRTLRSSMIHGLTAFFVMCYSQCARVSFQILGPMYLYKTGPEYLETVVFRSGQHDLFETEHLKYALPAFFFLFTLNVLPPIVLILYPLSYKILARCNLSESKFVNCVSRYVPMQLLDLFQSSFKDEVRFFAGLYFLYRMITLAAFSASRSLTEFYSGLELLLIIILALHAVVQPYKKRKHNIIDALLFANLAIINSFSLYNYQKAMQETISLTNQDTKFNYLIITAAIQMVLIFLPLICITIAFVVVVFRKICRHCKKRYSSARDSTHLLEDSCNLPPLRDDYMPPPMTSRDI